MLHFELILLYSRSQGLKFFPYIGICNHLSTTGMETLFQENCVGNFAENQLTTHEFNPEFTILIHLSICVPLGYYFTNFINVYL